MMQLGRRRMLEPFGAEFGFQILIIIQILGLGRYKYNTNI